MGIEVKTRLAFDSSEAEKKLSKAERQFAQLNESMKKNATAVGGFFKNAASTAVGVYLPQMARGAVRMAKSFFDAAESAESSKKSFTGLYSMFRDIPFEQAAEEAKGMREELRQMAVEIGEKPADAYSTFQTVARAMGADTADQMKLARQQTEQLMVIADSLGMQVGDLAGEFAMFSKAPRIMRGPMFDILRATGIFGKDLATMNKNWTKLTEDAKQGALAKALELQASKMKQVPETWKDMSDRFEEVLKHAKEVVGKPVLKALMPVASEIMKGLTGATPQLEGIGEAIGKKAAEWLRKGYEYAKDAFAYLQQHGPEIKAWISDAADKVKAAFKMAWEAAKFIYDHKEIIAAGAIAPKVVGGVSALGTMAGGAAKSLGATGEMAGGVGGFGALLKALGSGSVVAGAGAIAAAAFAVAGIAAAAYNGKKLYDDLKRGTEGEQDAMARLEAAEKMLKEGRLDEAKAMKELAMSEAAKTKDRGPGVLKAAGNFDKQVQDVEMKAAQLDATYNAAVNRFGTTLDESSNRTAKLMDELVYVYNGAVKDGNVAMQQSAASVLLQSQASRDMLVQSGLVVAGGINKMDELIVNAYKKFLADIGAGGDIGGMVGGGVDQTGRDRRAEMRKAMKEGAKKGGAAVEVNMGGGQTFNIKQDFRDQDPDRVAVVFQRDIVRASLSRRQSRMTSIFGVI